MYKRIDLGATYTFNAQYGIQSYTKQLDLNFDVDMNVKRGIEERKVSYTPFINLGVSISSLEIIKFLDENNIKYESK